MHPVLFQSHGVTIYSYGFCVALAVTLAFIISVRRAARKNLSDSTAIDLLFVVFIAGVVGARIFYVLQHWADYGSRWAAIFWIQEGGLVWYGGFIFAGLAGWCYCRRYRLSVLAWADFFAPTLALAHGVGRIGCFLNGCCYGKNGLSTQLYEASGLLALSAFIFWVTFKKTRAGEATAWYLVLYGALRFGVEFFRGDQSLAVFLTIPQWISICLFLLGLYLMKKARFLGNENKH